MIGPFFSSAEAVEASGVSTRQLDWWLRIGAVRPAAVSHRPGTGNRVMLSAAEVAALADMGRLLEALRAEEAKVLDPAGAWFLERVAVHQAEAAAA